MSGEMHHSTGRDYRQDGEDVGAPYSLNSLPVHRVSKSTPQVVERADRDISFSVMAPETSTKV